MHGSVGLEVMNSTNSELNWNPVTKGRRSRKSAGRSSNGILKAGNSTSPKRVGDFSGSDSDKFSEVFCGRSTSGKSENVPIKKRRHLLQTPLCHQESTSPQTHIPFSEDHEYPSCSSSQRVSTWQGSGVNSAKVGFAKGFDHILLCERTGRGYKDAEDFSGIELLAAAASMDEDNDNNEKDNFVTGEDPSVPKTSNESSSAAQSELGLNGSKSENSLSTVSLNEGSVDCSPVTNNSTAVPDSSCRSPADGAVPKVNRRHWDLNTLMDAWDEPYDDSLAGNSKDVDDGMHMEDRQEACIVPVLSNVVGAGDESSDPKMEEHNSATIYPDRTCGEPSNLVKQFPDPPNVSCSEQDTETSNQATEEAADERDPDQILSCDAQKEILDQVPKTDVTMLSGGMMPKQISSTVSGAATAIKQEDCSVNLTKTESTVVSERIQPESQDINVRYMPASEESETAIDVEYKNVKEPFKPRESPDTCVQDATDSKIGNDDGTLIPDSVKPDCQGLQPDELVPKHEDNSFPHEGSKGITMEDSCKSSSAGPQCDDPSSSIGKIGSTFDTQHDSDVSQDNHFNVVDGDELTRFDEGYDSPYEDGELRSFSYSWEDNELENECVDYESDGRNGDGPNAADHPGSEIVEDGSEGSHGTQRGSSSVKRLPEGSESKTGPIRHSMRRHFAKDDSDNNERAGKGSNAGSGTTVEQSMEMNVEENDDAMKRRTLTDRRGNVDVKMAQMDDYASMMGRGKLQSRIEGRSSLDGNDAEDVFFAPQCRSRRLGFSYSRPERDMSPDKHFVRYRPATHGEREGDRHLTSWGSRRRCTSSYQGSEGRIYTRPRSIAGDLDKLDGLDIHDPRQTANYLSKGMHRPLIRSPSERDEYFSVRKRMPLSRGISGYRSRGHYSQRAGREFREDFEPLPDDIGQPVRFSRYLSRRDRSFSPSSGRSAHMPLPRRRSRSRSRTRSLGPWRRDRILNIRRHSRSPDFRSEARMDRMRVPFSKPTFATADYGEDYISPSRGRFSPQRNHPRWVEDHPFPDNHLRRRRSPVRVFKRAQRFESAGSSGRLKSDEYFRPMIRPGRFSFKPNSGGGGCKFESNYEDRRCGDGSDMVHRGLHSDDGANIRRFRHNAAADDFEASNLNNSDDARASDAPQGDREDKRSFKI